MDRRRQFLQLFLAHERDLRAYVATAVMVPSARDDVMQEVALALWKAFDRYDPNRSFGAWARGVATHKVIDHHRREGRWRQFLQSEALDAVRRAFDSAEGPSDGSRHEQEALDYCLKSLPQRSAELIALRYTTSTPIQAMADQLETTAAAIYQQLSRVRTALAGCVRRRLAASKYPVPRP